MNRDASITKRDVRGREIFRYLLVIFFLIMKISCCSHGRMSNLVGRTALISCVYCLFLFARSDSFSIPNTLHAIPASNLSSLSTSGYLLSIFRPSSPLPSNNISPLSTSGHLLPTIRASSPPSAIPCCHPSLPELR